MARAAHCLETHGPDPARDPGGHCSACRRERKLRERSEHRELLQRLKAERGCQRCGSRDDLAFRHPRPGSHTYRPARGGNAVVYMVRWGTDRLLAEVAKCDLLCSACSASAYHQPLPASTSTSTPMRPVGRASGQPVAT